MQLSKLVVPITEVEFEFPGFEGFNVKLAHLTRDEMLKLRKKATSTKFNKRSHQPEEEVDSDLFQDLYIKSIVKGWSGLKYKYLNRLLPVDLSQIDDVELELEYTHDNAVSLMKNSPNFDGFVTDMVGDLENFTKSNSDS